MLFGDLDIFLQLRKDLILALRVVMLVQPAQNLDTICKCFLRNFPDQLPKDTVLVLQIFRQQKRCPFGKLWKQMRTSFFQIIAQGDQQMAVLQFIVFTR